MEVSKIELVVWPGGRPRVTLLGAPVEGESDALRDGTTSLTSIEPQLHESDGEEGPGLGSRAALEPVLPVLPESVLMQGQRQAFDGSLAGAVVEEEEEVKDVRRLETHTRPLPEVWFDGARSALQSLVGRR
jgi:hypothetical protein